FYGVPNYSTTKNSGIKSLNLTGTTYAMLPYAATHQDEMTIATWVRWNSNGKNWERLFDFGNGEQQYMFFTPSNGSQMRFVMKNNGDEQILTNNKKLATTSWHHIAITLKPTGDKVQAILYLDGTNVAESNDFTIKPSDIAPSVCYIGRSMFPADPLFNGRIDDFRIYNYALTADEIATMMEDRGELSKDLSDHVEDAIPTSIHAPESENEAWKTNSRTWYNLNGQPVSENQKGILLQAGKKKLNR
ncbi:MAG: LamG domain-containing protein, partial [Bacteroidaceae bacterium]|nr:LamG domain-containing protein [Bacteroidaceae bacterium]